MMKRQKHTLRRKIIAKALSVAVVLSLCCGFMYPESGIIYSSDQSANNRLSSNRAATYKRALVIGLGEQKDRSWAKINGDKDVGYVRQMLSAAGYTDVLTLMNKQATKAAIVSAFKSLASRCRPGDMVYIHFSGHGQQVTDTNGDEILDNLDESWIPYDAYLAYGPNDHGEKHLLDDEINALLSTIRNKVGKRGKIMVVVDTCHSGDSSRGDDDLGEIVRGASDIFVIPRKAHSKTTMPKERWLTLSACQDFQLNQELKQPQVGKLTYALFTLSKNGRVSMRNIETFMDKHRSRLPQTPVQTGDTITQKISDFLK